MTDVAGLPRSAGLALRAGAVTMASAWAFRIVAEEAGPPLAGGEPSGSTANALGWALLAALLVAGALTVTPRARLGMLGIGVTAALVDGFGLWNGASGAVLAPFCHAARWLGPLAFVVASAPGAGAAARSRAMLAVAAAATFAGHGIEAFGAPPHFEAYLQCACRIVTGGPCSDAIVHALLVGIGIADLAVAALVFSGRRGTTAALAWMVIWGAATAAVRCVHGGLDAWTLTAERIPNATVPLALLLARMHRTPDA